MPLRLIQLLLNQLCAIPAEVEARFSDETLCRRCGSCCHAAIKVEGKFVLLPDLPCRYLAREEDGRTRCRIYSRRESTGFCNKLSRQSVERNLFPPECPYLQGIQNYQGKVKLSPEEFQTLRPTLRKIFQDYPHPASVAKRDWDSFLGKVLGLDDADS